MSLAALDPRKLVRLRSEKHAELKNELMMLLLPQLEWFRQYRRKLRAHRRGEGPPPAYPDAQVDRVETIVDELIVRIIDPAHER